VEAASPVSAVAPSRGSSIREPRESPTPVEPSTFRIVVFYSREILVIPCKASVGTRARGMKLTSGGTVGKAWRVKKHDPEPTPSSASLIPPALLTLIPTNPIVQSYLITSVFKSDLSDSLPGIPLDQARLREMERIYRVDFDSVVLEFRSQKGESSHWSYRIACSERTFRARQFQRHLYATEKQLVERAGKLGD
jgi:hypothetical protein